ncbi:sensor histidine kinase [Streptomyces griseocarneus]|uniref:sensor histidine kinase n=1 Tax=Streptomyces griseocarneus TaxID=51201 RepID=UPI00167CA82E|nr:histidine kinase [Streptomyces griseocarneus]MBZ6472163.1 histidine kinase [Streptomyces griseocarneus]GHG73508.1 two-component sensor histidine kinase [Streptomyces griseocarneus]
MGKRQGRGTAEDDAARHRPPGKYAFVPWLFMIAGDVQDLVCGELPLPWLGGAGVVAFAGLYIATVWFGLDRDRLTTRTPRLLLLGLAAVTYALTIGYGGDWLLCFPVLSLAAGVVLRGERLRDQRLLGLTVLGFAGSSGVIAGFHGSWEDSMGTGYGTILSGLVTATVLRLSETVTELRATREELARAAVERERLRFSRDLHDLLGHTMSVIVVKAEAVRRLAPRDLDAALGQAADIEAVGRQALTEIREAVTGYRAGGLTTELESARSVLDASGVTVDIRQSGPVLPPQTAALLGWVVREGVTNVVRHSGAARCAIEVRGEPDRVHLEITDDGRGVGSAPGAAGAGGNGLKGLTERLAAAGGSLTSGPDGRRGFRLVAELPVDDNDEEGRAA